MISRLFSGSALHENADPAQRILSVARLAADSPELARLLAGDAVAAVRAAAAARCSDPLILAAALAREADAGVRSELVAALARVVIGMPDGAGARAMLEGPDCSDAVRAEVARRSPDMERRRLAIGQVRDEAVLVDLALDAGHAETRLAAAERVTAQAGLRALADAAKNKDNGVFRLARLRLDALEERHRQDAEADAVLAELEARAADPGPIVSAVVELNRRWSALDMSADPARRARFEAARHALQMRFEREQEAQRTRVQLERRLREWIGALDQAVADAQGAGARDPAALRSELEALREAIRGEGVSADVPRRSDRVALAMLDDAARRIDEYALARAAFAPALALVVEAEQLAMSTSIDNARLPERWQALARTIRTADLTQRFEAALMLVEQRRLEHARAAREASNALRLQIEVLLAAAEQALGAGRLQAARAAAEEIKARRAGAGALPHGLAQRLAGLTLQLGELERWESFGRLNARLQLCERAEALAGPLNESARPAGDSAKPPGEPVKQSGDPAKIALEVRKLRDQWKVLDQQHPGVPRALWVRFDKACERAYAPAAKHFAEQAAQKKQARRQREEFIAASAARVPPLLQEPRDWRAIERWLRENDQGWREGNLGSVDPGEWKKLDAKMKTTVAPLREALAAARGEAKAARVALIDAAKALAAKAMERDTPAQLKALQAKWQAESKQMSLAQRDERSLWDQFRAACDALFGARDAQRKQAGERKLEQRSAFEQICVRLETLAASEQDDQSMRNESREAQQQWQQAGRLPPELRDLEARYRKARSAVDATLAARARARETAVWQTLAAKERLCQELDERLRAGAAAAESRVAPATVEERWGALPALPPAWEQRMSARRDAARQALADPAAAAIYQKRIEQGQAARREGLLELELMLGMDSPAEHQPQRLALQVKQLRERFKGTGSSGGSGSNNDTNAGERLLAWCAQPGVADERDRRRVERIAERVARMK